MTAEQMILFIAVRVCSSYVTDRYSYSSSVTACLCMVNRGAAW